jgi:hypothetical protein
MLASGVPLSGEQQAALADPDSDLAAIAASAQ